MTMVWTGMSLMTIVAVTSGYLVPDTTPHQYRKWHKPYSYGHHQPKYLQISAAVHHKQQPLPPPSPPLPPLPPYPSHGSPEKPFKTDNPCELRKSVFTQDPTASPQYIVYKTKIPDLKEFTLCHWHNLFNHTHDHPIFSYSQSGKTRTIYSWIENSPQKTYYSLAINGHTIYRINYPEKLFKWYHVCQSWNGYTGEWQLWINTERVARGFYNLMVGKVIKGGGVAISGREYLEQAVAIHYPSLSGELTLLSLYKAALTAGKAYNDHKHHHVHNFHHGYDESVDEADTEEPDTSPMPTAPAGPEPTRPPHLAHGGPFNNGQLVPKLPVKPITKAVAAAVGPKDLYQPTLIFDEQQHALFDGGLYDFYSPIRGIGGVPTTAADGEDDTFRVNLLDRADDRRYKRNTTEEARGAGTARPRRWTPVLQPSYRTSRSGDITDPKHEPAEWEVTKVASVCAACESDPFAAAAVLSWHDTRKQFYNGVLYLPALPQCYSF